MRVRKSVALPRLQKAVVNETASREGAQQFTIMPKFVNQCKIDWVPSAARAFSPRSLERSSATLAQSSSQARATCRALKLRNEQLKQTVQELKTELAQQKPPGNIVSSLRA